MEEIQKNLLSIAMLYPGNRHLIFKGLEECHFTSHYRTIFKACKNLYLQNKEIDPVIIVSVIGNEYFNVVVELTDTSLIIKPNTEEYIRLLKYNYSKKQALIKTKNLLLMIEQNVSSEKIQKEYLEISKLFNNQNNKFRSYNMMEGFKMILDNLENNKSYYKTGFKKLDENVLIDKGDLIIIGGRPSSGKTTFATNAMAKMSEYLKVVFFSYETSGEGIFQKIASSGARINIGKILHCNLKDTEFSSFLNTASEYSKYNLEVIEASGATIEDIIATSLQYKADVIFIDYMQLINEKGTNSYEKVSEISRKLHTFAQKEKVTVIALSQLKRTGTAEPTMSDLRESGQIEQDADAVILIHNPGSEERGDIEKQNREVIIAKNKKGQLGKLYYNFYGGVQTFYEN